MKKIWYLTAVIFTLFLFAGTLPATAEAAPSVTPIYRLYKSKAKDHYYTQSVAEYNALGKKGWKKQGIAWYAPSSGSGVYCVYNKKTKDHQYVATAKAMKKLLKKKGFKKVNKNKAVFYRGGNVKVYKAYNKKAKNTYYTTNYREYKKLKKKTWKKKGVAFYAFAVPHTHMPTAIKTMVQGAWNEPIYEDVVAGHVYDYANVTYCSLCGAIKSGSNGYGVISDEDWEKFEAMSNPNGTGAAWEASGFAGLTGKKGTFTANGKQYTYKEGIYKGGGLAVTGAVHYGVAAYPAFTDAEWEAHLLSHKETGGDDAIYEMGTDARIQGQSLTGSRIVGEHVNKADKKQVGTKHHAATYRDEWVCAHCGCACSPIAVSSVSLNRASATLEVGKSMTLIASIAPSNASVKTIAWNSSNTSVATVSGGTVKAIKPGKATITATSNNGKVATCLITVPTPPVPVDSVSLSSSELEVKVDESKTLTATILPANATVKTVTWTSSKPSVATVSNGKITGKSVGTVTITAKSNNGKSASCEVTVLPKDIPATKVVVTPSKVELKRGESVKLTAKVYPENATSNTEVEWGFGYYSNGTPRPTSDLVTISSDGTVTANPNSTHYGNTFVSATLPNGQEASCAVKLWVDTTFEGYWNATNAYAEFANWRTNSNNWWAWRSSTEIRYYTGLQALQRDEELEEYAKARAKDAWIRGFEQGIQDHESTTGYKRYDVAENLLWGYTSTLREEVAAERIIYSWSEENDTYEYQGHRRNMLSPLYTKVGIAIYVKDGKVCACMILY